MTPADKLWWAIYMLDECHKLERQARFGRRAKLNILLERAAELRSQSRRLAHEARLEGQATLPLP